MDPSEMLTAIDAGQTIPNSTVFRFNRLRTVANLVLYGGFAVALVAVCLLLRGHINLAAGGVAYGAIGVFGLILLLTLWRAWNKGRDLLHAASNLLVVAPFGVVRRLRGGVKVWAFAELPEVTVVAQKGSIESIYLNRRGATFDQLLVDDGSFGPMSEIASALRAHRPGA